MKHEYVLVSRYFRLTTAAHRTPQRFIHIYGMLCTNSFFLCIRDWLLIDIYVCGHSYCVLGGLHFYLSIYTLLLLIPTTIICDHRKKNIVLLNFHISRNYDKMQCRDITMARAKDARLFHSLYVICTYSSANVQFANHIDSNNM